MYALFLEKRKLIEWCGISAAAERDAKASWQNHTGGKTFFEESLDEKKRKDEEERQRRKNHYFLLE